MAFEINRILGSSNRHSYDLQREADVIRQDVEAQNLDITGGLPQVEEIFEARVPKNAAILSDIDGEVELESDEENNVLRVVYREEVREEYPLPEGAQILVEDGDMVDAGYRAGGRPPSRAVQPARRGGWRWWTMGRRSPKAWCWPPCRKATAKSRRLGPHGHRIRARGVGRRRTVGCLRGR